MTTCLVTGANGFVGSLLCADLNAKGYTVHGCVRSATVQLPINVSKFITGNLDANTNWHAALANVDYVFHLAATVHRPDIQDPKVYHSTITLASVNLAKQALAAGVKRFIYLSTSHVYGVENSADLIAESAVKNPITVYGIAKLAAENKLQRLVVNSPMELVIVRPPLIYGPGVRGNLALLANLINKCPVLPLGCATQKRSFVGIDNLLSFLQICMHHPAAANAIFNISDGQDKSTRELCEIIAQHKHKKLFLLPVPHSIMKQGLKLIRRTAMYNKLFGSFCLDVTHAQTALNWQPPFSVQQQLLKILPP